MCVGFLYTVYVVSIPSLYLFNKQSKKGSLLSSSDSMVNYIEALTDFKWSDKRFSLPFLTMQKVSSTYLFHNTGLPGDEFKSTSSKLATTVETGEPLAAPSTCSSVPVVPKVS